MDTLLWTQFRKCGRGLHFSALFIAVEMAEQSCANGSECSSQKALADQLVQRTENGATADPHVPMASQTTTTNIMNITLTNVGQVIHVSGEHQVVNIPQPTVQMFQQAIGFNPTVGVSNNAQSFPSRSSHQCSDPSQPEGFETPTHDPPGSHRELPYASTFAEGTYITTLFSVVVVNT